MDGGVANPVVVGVDGSAQARAAAGYAGWEAHRRRVPLHLITVEQPPRPCTGTAYVSTADGCTPLDLLHEEAARVGARYPELTVRTRVLVGDPGRVLCSPPGCLVVVGYRGMGSWRSPMLGSVATMVAARCPVPAVVVRPVASELADGCGGVVVAIGGREEPAVLAFALEEAAARDTGLTVVHVGAAATRVPVPAGVREVAMYETVLHDDNRVRGLVECSADADLLVVGRHRDTPAVVRNAVVPVAVVPAQSRYR